MHHKDEHATQPWRLYAHFQANANTYGTSYVHMVTIESLETWARVWNNVPFHVLARDDSVVCVGGKRVTTYSLFRDTVLPEWEDPTNANGHTLTHRVTHNAARALPLEVWKSLFVECIRGAEPDDVVGVQVTKKQTRGALVVKFDVWLRASADVAAVSEWLEHVVHLPFTSSRPSSLAL